MHSRTDPVVLLAVGDIGRSYKSRHLYEYIFLGIRVRNSLSRQISLSPRSLSRRTRDSSRIVIITQGPCKLNLTTFG